MLTAVLCHTANTGASWQTRPGRWLWLGSAIQWAERRIMTTNRDTDAERDRVEAYTTAEYQPRYLQFARVRGFEPGSPDAPMPYEFVIWIRLKWREWASLNGRRDTYGLTQEDHAAFDAWLRTEG